MPFFVAVHHEGFPDRREQRVEMIRRDFAASPISHPGRRFARLFEHLQDQSRLFAVEEWLNRADFERHERSADYLQALSRSGSPPRYEELGRLQHYRHLPRRPAALACTAIETPVEHAAEVESYICDAERRDALVAEGLVLRAVYRVVSSPGRLLILHGWQSLDHLERYLDGSAQTTAATLAAHGAALDQFAGRVAAEYSWLES